MLGVAPSQDSSAHQDYETFSVGGPFKPSFTTVTGRGPHPNYMMYCRFNCILCAKQQGQRPFSLFTHSLQRHLSHITHCIYELRNHHVC